MNKIWRMIALVGCLSMTGAVLAQSFDEAMTLAENGDLVLASKAFERLANDGDVRAMRALGDYYRANAAVGKAQTWYEKGAQADHSSSMYALGRLILDSDLAKGDRELGMFWLKVSADRGYPPALYDLGVIENESGRNGDPFIEQAAKLGSLDAKYVLALEAIDSGQLFKAKPMLQEVAWQGHKPSLRALAWMAEEEGSEDLYVWVGLLAHQGDSLAQAIMQRDLDSLEEVKITVPWANTRSGPGTDFDVVAVTTGGTTIKRLGPATSYWDVLWLRNRSRPVFIARKLTDK